MKQCPLSQDDCLEEECGWWIGAESSCAVLYLPYLGYLGYLRDIT